VARPLKQGADWFKHDKDMRKDEKILAVRRKFGHLGYSIWCMTLEKLTDSDGFSVGENPLDMEFQAAEFDIDVPKLKEIWDYFVAINILQREKINGQEGTFIGSRHLKHRFEGLIANRNRDTESFRQRKCTDESRLDKNRLREGRSAVGGPPLDTVDKSRQSPPLAEIEKAALIRQARESKKAGLSLMAIEKRALQEIGEEPPDPPDTFDDSFPEASS